MELKKGADTIINQCLQVEDDEKVLVLNDSNDKELINTLLDVLVDRNINHELIEYEEPESSGSEPPLPVAEEMKRADVVIAPTVKSISHTDAREQANKHGTRVASLPGINKEVWSTSLLADYEEVKNNTEKVYGLLEDAEKVRVKTPSGTDLKFDVDIETYIKDTGICKDEGDMTNLPAGEPNGFPENISGTLVIDHFPFSPKTKKVEIEDGKVTDIEDEEGETSELSKAFKEHPCTKRIAEFGFGTNPKATLIGNTLQDEKVFGTVHFAFGDNCFYVGEGDERRNPCEHHQDSICEEPTVWFDDQKILDKGEPVFMD